jgi:hypothetical protein
MWLRYRPVPISYQDVNGTPVPEKATNFLTVSATVIVLNNVVIYIRISEKESGKSAWLAWRPTVSTEAFCGFPQSLRLNAVKLL